MGRPARGVGLAAFLWMTAACAGGTQAGGDGGVADGGSSGTSGTNSGTCTEFQAGGMIGPGIGRTALSEVAAQSIADIAGASAAQLVQLTAACKQLAVALGASSADQTAADADAVPRKKAKAWCSLSVYAISTTKATAGGTLTVNVVPPSCKLAVAAKASCQGRCSASPCDSAANPFRCTGGTLSGGFCGGGKLEGGCKVDAQCDGNCDVAVAAAAQCVPNPVTVTINGAASAGAATSLKSALETNLPTVLALKAHFETEIRIAAVVTGNADPVSDLKAPCVPPVTEAASNASQDIVAGASASSGVAASVQ